MQKSYGKNVTNTAPWSAEMWRQNVAYSCSVRFGRQAPAWKRGPRGNVLSNKAFTVSHASATPRRTLAPCFPSSTKTRRARVAHFCTLAFVYVGILIIHGNPNERGWPLPLLKDYRYCIQYISPLDKDQLTKVL